MELVLLDGLLLQAEGPAALSAFAEVGLVGRAAERAFHTAVLRLAGVKSVLVGDCLVHVVIGEEDFELSFIGIRSTQFGMSAQ